MKLELLRRFILNLGPVSEGTEYVVPDSLLLHSLDPQRAPFDPKGANFRPERFLSPASASAFLEPRLITNPLLSTCPPYTLPTTLCGPLLDHSHSMEACSSPPPCDGYAAQGVEVGHLSIDD